MSRTQKLRWYAGQLMKDAADEEKNGKQSEAVGHYLQAADLLLLLAKVEGNYTAWKFYADNASDCQKKAKALIDASQKSSGN